MLVKQVVSLSQLLRREARHGSANANDLFSASINHAPRQHDCYWRKAEESGLDLPAVVVPYSGDVETFYADVATYYPDMSPITAYMHVLSDEFIGLSGIKELTNDKVKFENSDFSIAKNRIWIALSIAEAASMVFSSGVIANSDVTYSICRRSLSFTIGRARFLYPYYPQEKVADRWHRLREISEMEFSPQCSASILWIARLAFNTLSSKQYLEGATSEHINALRNLVLRSSSSAQFGQYLVDVYPKISEQLHVVTGDYDGRMQGLTEIINAIRMHRRGVELDAMAIAYFCNDILPGSMAHIKMLARYMREYPSILIWYGFFSGLSDEFDWRGVLAGIGQKLSRDICSPFSLESQQCADVALDELEVLTRVGLSASAIKPVHQRTMLVSLMPGVDIWCRLPIEGGVEARVTTQFAQYEGRIREIEARDWKLRHLLSEAEALLRIGDTKEATLSSNRPVKEVRPKTKPRTKKNRDRY